MALSPLLVQVALALTPYLCARVLMLAPPGYTRWAVGSTLAAAAFAAVSVVALAPPSPATGLWFPIALLRFSGPWLAGLALAATVGVTVGLTTAIVQRQQWRSDILVTGLLLTAVAPVALLGNLALVALPLVLLPQFRARRLPVAANDNAPLVLPLAA